MSLISSLLRTLSPICIKVHYLVRMSFALLPSWECPFFRSTMSTRRASAVAALTDRTPRSAETINNGPSGAARTRGSAHRIGKPITSAQLESGRRGDDPVVVAWLSSAGERNPSYQSLEIRQIHADRRTAGTN